MPDRSDADARANHDRSGREGGSWDPDRYDDDHGFVAEYGRDLLDTLAPEPGERVLDVGCGTGRLTRRIADAGATPVGLDASPEMIERARESFPELEFVRGDVREFEADREFDAALSNAALHWIPAADQPRALGRVADALVPGGRLVAELGGAGNVETILGALRAEIEARGRAFECPWYFPSLGEYASLLEAAGFEVTFARLFDRPTELDGGTDGLRNWLAMFAESTLAGFDGGERAAVVDAVEERLRPELLESEGDAAGTWIADYRRLRVVARRSRER